MVRGSITNAVLAWGWTLSILLLVSYLLCIAFGVLAPERFHMHEVWAPLLPWFEWPTPRGFLAGAVGSFLYGWYIALIAVPLYRYFRRRTGNSV